MLASWLAELYSYLGSLELETKKQTGTYQPTSTTSQTSKMKNFAKVVNYSC